LASIAPEIFRANLTTLKNRLNRSESIFDEFSPNEFAWLSISTPFTLFCGLEIPESDFSLKNDGRNSA